MQIRIAPLDVHSLNYASLPPGCCRPLPPMGPLMPPEPLEVTTEESVGLLTTTLL